MFRIILEKHAIESDLKMELLKFSFKPTSLFQPQDVQFLIKSEQQVPKMDFSRDKTNYMDKFFSELTKNVTIDKECFGIPNYNKIDNCS